MSSIYYYSISINNEITRKVLSQIAFFCISTNVYLKGCRSQTTLQPIQSTAYLMRGPALASLLRINACNALVIDYYSCVFIGMKVTKLINGETHNCLIAFTLLLFNINKCAAPLYLRNSIRSAIYN